jgi:hypothetical protein
MKLQDISRKTVIIILIIIILILFIYFYSNKQENLETTNIIGQKFNELNQTYSKIYLVKNKNTTGLNINQIETRNDFISGNNKIILQENQIFILGDQLNNKIMVFDFNNAIIIYDFVNLTATTYLPKNYLNMSYKYYILLNDNDYRLYIYYEGDINQNFSIINKSDLFDLNNSSKDEFRFNLEFNFLGFITFILITIQIRIYYVTALSNPSQNALDLIILNIGH